MWRLPPSDFPDGSDELPPTSRQSQLSSTRSRLSSVFSSLSELNVSRHATACRHHSASIGQEDRWCHVCSDVSVGPGLQRRQRLITSCSDLFAAEDRVLLENRLFSLIGRRHRRNDGANWISGERMWFGWSSVAPWHLAALITLNLRADFPFQKHTLGILANLFINFRLAF